MEIFAAGNKYKCFSKAPTLIEGSYFVYGWKWIKSKKVWASNPSTYNIGPHYEEIKTNEERIKLNQIGKTL